MKKLITLLFIAFVAIAKAQIYTPVKWSTSVEKINDTEYYLVAKATIEAGWKLYGQNIPPNGPIPTTFEFEKNADFELVGKTKESTPILKHDKVFNMEISYFHNQAVFKQHIKLLNKAATNIKGSVEFMSCNDNNCSPPDTVDLVFELTDTAAAPAGVSPQFTFNNPPADNNAAPATTVSETKTEAINPTPIHNQGIWTIFFLSFLAGFAALLSFFD